MRGTVALLILLLALAGCGDESLPDAATSKEQIVEAVLDHQRAKADGDAGAACDGLTAKARAARVEFERRAPRSMGDPPADCEEAIEREPLNDLVSEILKNSRVVEVRVDGTRAVARAQTATPDGTVLDPVDISLLWSDGRWLIDT